MAYNSNIPQQKYVASAGQTVFPFLFKIFQESDLTVYNVAGGDDPELAVPLILNTDYTVIINGDLGGSITLTVGASDGDSISIYRRLDITRHVEYQTSGDLLANTLNNDQDYQTYLVADLADAVKEELSGEGPGTPVGDYVRKTGDIMTGQLSVPGGGTGAEVMQYDEIVDLLEKPVEIGTNANGTYFKYDNGLLMCLAETEHSPSTATENRFGTTSGTVYQDTVEVDFPYTFILAPRQIICGLGSGGGLMVRWLSSTTTSVTYNAHGKTSGSSMRVNYIAIGTWK